MKPKVNIFDGEKKNAISAIDLLYFGYLAVDRFLNSVFKEILNNLCVFKVATYVE